MNDQATRLREAAARAAMSPVGLGAHAAPAGPAPSPRRSGAAAAPGPRLSHGPGPPALARAIAVTSGKGGVGKTNLAVNLAVAMSGLGLRVCLLDADLGMANADVLCNLTPRLTLEHVVQGRCRLAQAALAGPGGFRLIPGASGVSALADLAAPARHALLRQLAALERVADVILIDTGAGISNNVLGFAAAAHTVALVTTPEPTAMTDGYGLVKSLAGMDRTQRVQVVVNQVTSTAEADDVYARLERVSRTFLHRPLGFGGSVPADRSVPAAVRLRVPVVLAAPRSPATEAIRRLAGHLVGLEAAQEVPAGGFLARLVRRFGAGGTSFRHERPFPQT